MSAVGSPSLYSTSFVRRAILPTPKSAKPLGPAYRIESDRLVARCWRLGDAPALRRALEDNAQHLRPWIPFMADEPRSLRETAEWLREQRGEFDQDVAYRYGLFLRAEETVLVGSVSLFKRVGPGGREVGYWIHKDHTGTGFATEAASMMVRLAFEVDDPVDVDQVDRVEIHCDPNNQASWGVGVKLGFQHEATLKRRFTDTKKNLTDTMIWTLFAADYAESPASHLAMRAFDLLGGELVDPGQG
jgi:RimJ/RimL family protein N-acetyltransferase